MLRGLDDEDSYLLVDELELELLFSDSELTYELDCFSDFDSYSDSCPSLMLSSSFSDSFSDTIS